MKRAITAAAASVVALGLFAAPAAADVDVTNTETVQVYLDATGEVDTARVYDQLDLTGSGQVEVHNPVTPDGLRNLDGFGGYSVEDDEAVVDLDVDGEQRVRTVSDFDDELPLSVSVEYTLDGEVVEPGDVVGESGELEVRYTVANETGELQEISYDNGTGAIVTSEEEVFVPMVGSMTMVLPDTFTDVTTAEGNAAGDGRGGTKLSFTLTLFPPIGKPEQEFGYTATITDGVIPEATLSALPVSPLDSPTFATAADGYDGGIDSGISLAEGAQTIDENLLRLRDGASSLLAGLIQLRDGAEQLSTGLADRAAPGAQELADGLGDRLAPGARELADGGDQLADGLQNRLAPGAEELASGGQQLADGLGKRLIPGANQLADGAGQLSDGLQNRLAPGAQELATGGEQLADGAGRLAEGLQTAEQKAPQLIGGLQQVSDGLGRLDGGLTQLYDGIGGLPEQAKPLHDGIAQLRAGIGDLDTEGTLLNGVHQIHVGLRDQAVPALEQMAAGVFNESASAPGAYQKLGCAVLVLNDLVEKRDSGFDKTCYGDDWATITAGRLAVKPSYDLITAQILTTLRDQLADGRAALANPDDPGDRDTLFGGLNTLKGALTSGEGILAGLVRIQCGLSSASLDACDSGQPGLLEGLARVDGGVTQLVDGVVASVQGGVGTPEDTPEDETLRGGVNGLSDGVDQIIAGGNTLLDGLTQLGDGANQLHDGSLRLSDGAGQLATGATEAAEGAGRLADGAGQLATGAEDAADGAGRIADGAGQLSDGADEAADGAGRIADGAGQLADGADEAATGAGTLADGLNDASDGSVQLYEGLQQAADGAPQIVDGTERLSTEGAAKLEEAGQSTAADFGTRYALLEAGAERATSEPLVNGAPEGAALMTAFSYELPAVTGEGGRNLTRGVVALVLFAAAAGVAALVKARRA